MPSKKISELSNLAVVDNNDYLLVLQQSNDGLGRFETYKSTMSALFASGNIQTAIATVARLAVGAGNLGIVYNNSTGEISVDFDYVASKDYVDSKVAILATVATSGSYNDLTDKPTFTTVLTTSATTADQTLASVSATTYRTVEYTISVKSGSAYHATKIMVLHDGTTAYLSQYGEILSGSSLATFDATISGGNIVLTTTPVNAITTYNVSLTAIAA